MPEEQIRAVGGADLGDLRQRQQLEQWLRAHFGEYAYVCFAAAAITPGRWLRTASSSSRTSWVSGGHLLPLPKEPAALANVLEVRIVDYLLDRLARNSTTVCDWPASW